MKIIDNFFKDHDLDLLTTNLNKEIQNDKCELFYYGQNVAADQTIYEENDHLGLENCRYYRLTENTLDITLATLHERKIITAEALQIKDCMLKYHMNRAPYQAKFHKDGLYENNNKLDYIGMTIFLNDWDTSDGGLFVYKSTVSDTAGTYVEPKKNRIIINPQDLPHAVTQITNPSVIRQSLQFFMNVEHLV